MKISYNWLSQYIHLEESPEEISDLLTSVGLEVEGLERVDSIPGGLEGLVVGKVIEKFPHPNADRLSCTKVDLGAGEVVPIVCGAPNVAAGQKVVVAKVGSTIHPTDGEPFKIKKAKIRGEVSEGMICAEDEIGVGESHDGIMVLDKSTKEGTPAAALFEVETDFVFEIGLTPNRADAASHYGVARDLAAALGHRKNKAIKLCRPSVEKFQPLSNDRVIPVLIENHQACPRYVGLTISKVKVQESPAWLKNKLRAIGVRPINNVVDVTNYICHAFGQPMHAFDADQIRGGQVIVQSLPAGTTFTTLDEVERKLTSNDLMICDEKGGMCIAGVFGGTTSGVTEKTTSIFLESAYFNPVSVRKTAKHHGLHTDASFRYERGTDPNICAYAAKLAALMIVDITGGYISSDLSDSHPDAFDPFTVIYDLKAADAFFGTEIPTEVSTNILKSLEIEVKPMNRERLELKVPPYKVDVQREADVREEVLRIFGFDAVPFSERIKSTVRDIKPTIQTSARSATTELLVANGFVECMSNSLVDEQFGGLSDEWAASAVVNINNPLSSEMGIMRPALIFSALQNAARNINRQQHNLKLFEFGNVYRIIQKQFKEEHRLSMLVAGAQVEQHWRMGEVPADWNFLRQSIEQVCARMGISMSELKTTETTADWFEYGLDWSTDKEMVMSGGLVSAQLCKALDIKKSIFYFEARWNSLVALRQASIQVGELPKYPMVTRDLALLVDKNTNYASLEEIAYKAERKILRNVRLFDVYEGKGLPAGKKSYALSFQLRDDHKTLTDKEVDKCMKRLLNQLEEKGGAQLRG